MADTSASSLPTSAGARTVGRSGTSPTSSPDRHESRSRAPAKPQLRPPRRARHARRYRLSNRLSVVIPALDEAQALPSLLQDLDRQARAGRPVEIIVADGGSSDD